jgi:hypothetical protein
MLFGPPTNPTNSVLSSMIMLILPLKQKQQQQTKLQVWVCNVLLCIFFDHIYLISILFFIGINVYNDIGNFPKEQRTIINYNANITIPTTTANIITGIVINCYG